MSEGLRIEELAPGAGPGARRGQTVEVHYTGWLSDGTKFDSSHDRGKPFRFRLGASEVILGWDDGLVGMPVGSKRRLTIPPDLAYGRRGRRGVIPGNATLVFEIELLAAE
jgi:FKBP-type peptidyl-prolyl cis-trans isomerase